MFTRFVPAVALFLAVLLVLAFAASCGGSQGASPDPASTPTPGPLTKDIPPCTPVEGSLVDPCEPDPPADLGGGGDIEPPVLRADGGPDLTLEELWEGYPSSTPHIAIRATYLPGTIRCSPEYLDYAYDYLSPSRWFGDGDPIIHCFADVRVNQYILGSGPTRLTLEVAFGLYDDEYHSEDEVWELVAEWERVLTSGGEDPSYGQHHEPLPGREQVMFIGPSDNASLRSWSAFVPLEVERKDDGTVVAVHPWRNFFTVDERAGNPTAFEMPLATLTQKVVAAQAARVEANGGRTQPGSEYPMLVTEVGKLDEFYEDAAVTGQEDPPPPCGLAVADQTDHPGLMRDCLTLLGLKDELRGTGTLNWSTGTQMADWDGVTVAGTPQRVTKLKLANKSLTGTIPAALAKLTGLNELKLAGNTLTGCIPLALKAVASHDLDSLGLLYCRPPAPGNVSTGAATETGIPLSWDAVSNAGKYRVEYREGDSGGWTLAGDTLTGTTHTVTGLDCESAYEFRLSAYGSGTVYATAWSEPSDVVTAPTGTCVTPAFHSHDYSFQAPYTAVAGDAVGTVSATDPNGDAVAYTITAGNDDGKFVIGVSTGDITMAAALEVGVVRSYTLTVRASDGTNAATATVEVAVFDPCDAGVVVANPTANPGLVSDCKTLLGLKSTLAGDAALNWSADGLGRRASPRLAQPGREAAPAAEGADGQRPAGAGRVGRAEYAGPFQQSVDGRDTAGAGDTRRPVEPGPRLQSADRRHTGGAGKPIGFSVLDSEQQPAHGGDPGGSGGADQPEVGVPLCQQLDGSNSGGVGQPHRCLRPMASGQ